MGGAVVVEAPVFGEIAVGLLAALAWIVCLGLAYAYRNTFGWFLERLAEILPAHHWYFPVDLRGAVRGINHDFYTVLTRAAEKSEYAMGYLFHGAAVLQEWASREMLHLASETLADVEWLAHVHVPNSVKWALRLAIPPLLIAHLVKLAVEAELPHLLKVTQTIVNNPTKVFHNAVTLPYLGQWQYLHKHWKALLAALAAAGAPVGAGAFPWVHVFPRLGALERDAIHTRKRVHKLWALLGVTAFAGMMAKVLGLPNWRCLTRGNVGRASRALCGIPTHLLNDLLGLMVDFFVLTEICHVVTILEDALAVVQPELEGFILAANAIACYGDEARPPTFNLAPLVETPLQPGAPALAG